MNLQLHSPTIIRLAVMELYTAISKQPDADGLLKSVLKDFTESDDRELSRLSISINIGPLLHKHRSVNEIEWKAAALTYLVSRGANFPMLQDLFKTISRRQIKSIRESHRFPPPPTKPHSIPTADLDGLYRAWKQIQTDFENPIEQWVAIAEVFPQFSVCSVYTTIVFEGNL